MLAIAGYVLREFNAEIVVATDVWAADMCV